MRRSWAGYGMRVLGRGKNRRILRWSGAVVVVEMIRGDNKDEGMGKDGRQRISEMASIGREGKSGSKRVGKGGGLRIASRNYDEMMPGP